MELDFAELNLQQKPVGIKYPLVADAPVMNEPVYEFQGKEVAPKVSWANQYPPVWNQGQTNSCTAQSLSAVLAVSSNKFDPSRLFQYYNERAIYGLEYNTDAIYADIGVNLRTAVKAFFQYGICSENLWPFSLNQLYDRPTENCYTAAIKGPLLSAIKIATPYSANKNLVKQLVEVISLGQPVVIGISVFQSMETLEVAQTGLVPLPSGTRPSLGGHAIPLVGYNLEKEIFIFRNSWGSNWGHAGYGYLPFSYINMYCMSAWTFLKTVNTPVGEQSISKIM